MKSVKKQLKLIRLLSEEDSAKFLLKKSAHVVNLAVCFQYFSGLTVLYKPKVGPVK